MQLIKFLDNIFSEHLFLTVAFSGFGLALISLIIFIIKKFFISHKHPVSGINVSETQSAVIHVSQIENDINTIKESINCDFSDKQKGVFLRYFNKYKNCLDRRDIESLNNQVSEAFPNYSYLLNQLLGLIETLNKQ